MPSVVLQVQADNDPGIRDHFDELPVSLVLVCLICVDIIERIRPCRLLGSCKSWRRVYIYIYIYIYIFYIICSVGWNWSQVDVLICYSRKSIFVYNKMTVIVNADSLSHCHDEQNKAVKCSYGAFSLPWKFKLGIMPYQSSVAKSQVSHC